MVASMRNALSERGNPQHPGCAVKFQECLVTLALEPQTNSWELHEKGLSHVGACHHGGNGGSAQDMHGESSPFQSSDKATSALAAPFVATIEACDTTSCRLCRGMKSKLFSNLIFFF